MKSGQGIGVKIMTKALEVLDMIAQDMKDDAEKFDGQPFTGKTVAQYFGKQGAAISALAKIIKKLIEEQDKE